MGAPRTGFCALVALLLAVSALVQPNPARARQDFRPLFDGKSLAGWVVENSDAHNFSVADGVIKVSGPNGWLRSADQFGNFTLRVEVRFLTDDADSGIFLRAPGPASNIFIRGWPANAYQVQVRDMSRNKTTNPFWAGNLYRHRVAPGETTFEADRAIAAIKPTGEWQLFEVDAEDDVIVARVNGVPVLRAAGIVNPRGHIGLQGETGQLEYRRIDVMVR
jgi:hypothetical protein